MINEIPHYRIRRPSDKPINPNGSYVVYWMTGCRRSTFSFALQRAIRLSQEHSVGLIVLEALRIDYPYASDRFHSFVIQGMLDNREAFEAAGISYLPYVERALNEGKGLLRELSKNAVCVVTDDVVNAFYPRMIQAASQTVSCSLEAVDGDGILPIGEMEQAWPTAHAFRRHLQKRLPPFLSAFPTPQPLKHCDLAPVSVPVDVLRRWEPLPSDKEECLRLVSTLDIDHSVGVVEQVGGEREARKRLKTFLEDGLERYTERNHPDENIGSTLSAYLHFGQISSFEILQRIFKQHRWSPDLAASKATGSRSGWWGLPADIESFLDQIVTWRELGRTWAVHRPDDYMAFQSIPSWAQESLRLHASDPRPAIYSEEELEYGKTSDQIWNAAQQQLVKMGAVHNYVRMLWGKNVMAWTQNPEEAARILVHLNDKWALDGRDPNSYSGIFWVFGRHDRAWGPERPIYGKVRYMTSANTKRKLKMDRWLARWGG